jgi:peptidoglycan/xylan/chitin deacetylase (PgdA/CDA1 family)
MRVAGIGWRDEEYGVVVVDSDGHDVLPPAGYEGRRLSELRAALLDLGAPLSCVVDSTSGALDGYLMAGGLTVYRADPGSLPARPAHGSAPARTLAELGRTDPAALTRLRPETGSLAGRDEEYAAHIAASAAVERELAGSGQLVVRGTAVRPDVALTFDDGPDPAFTPRVLDILRRHGVRATFFCVGMNACAYPELVARILDEGHGVGNHTWSHPYLPDLSRDEVLRQVDATGTALAKVTGTAPALIRPPYGSRTPEVLRWIAGQDLTTVLWDVDAGDWAGPPAAAITARVTTATTAGSIVLMHDAGGDRSGTVAALPDILENLLRRGFRCVTVADLH